MPTPTIRTIDEAIERLYRLKVGVVGVGSARHERPHKPLLLLAAFDLIAKGQAEAGQIPWSPALRDRFSIYFEVVRRNDDQKAPDLPFYHLKGDHFWEPFELQGGLERPLGNTPTVGQAKAGTVFTRVAEGMDVFFGSPESRAKLRRALVARYFPKLRAQLQPLFVERTPDSANEAEFEAGESKCSEDDAEAKMPGRDPAFRRIVLEAYDFQCAACGLRIKLPDADLTFVDGAHLIPFRQSYNDHPTNGLALCKNHHWAMDRFLIVPTPEGIWRVSGRLDARRSEGERELMEIHEKRLLPPHDDAFRPDPLGLAWRAARIYA